MSSKNLSLTHYLTQLLTAIDPPRDVRAEALASVETGDAAASHLLLIEALALNPVDAELWLALVEVCVRLGDHEGALAALRHARPHHARPKELLMREGELLLATGDDEGALAAFRKVIAATPEKTDAYVHAGMILERRGELEPARTQLELALQRDPRATVARFHLARVCVALGDLNRAVAQLHYLEHLQPGYVPARLLNAQISEQLGHHRQVVALLGDVTASGAVGAQVEHRLGLAHLKLGAPAQAIACFKRALATGHASVETMCHAARTHEQLNQLEAARDLYQRVAQIPGYQLFGQGGLKRTTLALAQIQAALVA